MSRRGNNEDATAEELSVVVNLSRADLIARWEATHKKRPPKGISRRLLEYSTAYALQEKALGGLKASMRRQLDRGDTNDSVPRRNSAASKKKLSVGARLVRDWHGRTHTVDVVEGGFRYDGHDFKSLSQIAREITGARWSGPRFFGL